MEYAEGQRLMWIPFSPHKEREVVTVAYLLKRGHAKLSNGWVVDEDGIAEGSGRIPGGSVCLAPT